MPTKTEAEAVARALYRQLVGPSASVTFEMLPVNNRSAWESKAYDALREAEMVREGPSRAAFDVLAERERQQTVEGWTPEHDDSHVYGDIALAACCYAMPEGERASGHASGVSVLRALWPWYQEWWKPKGRREDLVRAGALILAEIERLDRAERR